MYQKLINIIFLVLHGYDHIMTSENSCGHNIAHVIKNSPVDNIAQHTAQMCHNVLNLNTCCNNVILRGRCHQRDAMAKGDGVVTR